MKLAASDRSSLVKLAALLPKGAAERQTILAFLKSGTKMEKDLDESKPILMKGLKGTKSTPSSKKFKNMAAYDKWADSEEAGDWTVQSLENA